MPELPEVEVQRRALVRWLRHRRVLEARAAPSRLFRGTERASFLQLRGRLLRAERRGKYLLLDFESHGVLSHLGMTGKWVRRKADAKEPFSRAELHLDSGDVLHFRDPRRFGRLEVVPAGENLLGLPVIRALGRDLLVDGLTPNSLEEAVRPSRQPLKVALMDQGRLAGLGNIHAAEALYRAKLNPSRLPSSLTKEEWKRLARGIEAALAFALEHEDGEEIRYVEEPGSENPFLVYGRAKEACPRCQTEILSLVQAGRTTYYCAGCQPLRQSTRGTGTARTDRTRHRGAKR